MARKTITKEVTQTTLKLGRVSMENGQHSVFPVEDQTMIGNVTLEKAQAHINKENTELPITVFQVIPSTIKYEMPLEDFIKHAAVIKEEEQAATDAPA